jgi:hypothetical protein
MLYIAGRRISHFLQKEKLSCELVGNPEGVRHHTCHRRVTEATMAG